MEPETKPPMGGTEDVSTHPPAPLLPPETEARLRSMAKPYGRLSENQAESYEAKRQKTKDSRALNDHIRLNELRTIPKAQRSQGEQREFARLYNRERRKKEKGESADAMANIKSREEFWALHRATASTAKISEWKKRNEEVLSTLAWLDRLDAAKESVELCGDNYVSVEQGLPDLLADVKEYGVTHLGYITRNEELPSDWSTGSFSKKPFWRNPEVFRMLCDESPATERWAKYGLLTALPDYRVIEFLTNRCGWEWRKAAELVGIQIKRLGYNPDATLEDIKNERIR